MVLMKQSVIKVKGYTAKFSDIFAKTTFVTFSMFVSLENKELPKLGLQFKKRIFS